MSDIADAAPVTCGCCGELRPATTVTALNRRPDVVVCGGCVNGLASKLHARPTVTPIFPVRDMDEAWHICASSQGWTQHATQLRATSTRQIRLAGMHGGQQPVFRSPTFRPSHRECGNSA